METCELSLKSLTSVKKKHFLILLVGSISRSLPVVTNTVLVENVTLLNK